MNSKQDLKLCYFGGSGGFIVLHLLLLSEQFYCCFDDEDLDLEQIIDRQWQISESMPWKSNEYWPDNNKTRNASKDQRKIYFFCNPDISQVSELDGQIFLLYLDADSQIEMAKYKHAYDFYNESTSLYKNYVAYYRAKLKGWREHYKNIKDPSWPNCTGPAGFKILPSHIKNELLEHPYTKIHLDIKKYKNFDPKKQEKALEEMHSRKIVLTDGTKLLSEVHEFFKFADLYLNLKDIVNNLDLLSVISGVKTNQHQINLRNKWASIHPLWLLDNVGIQMEYIKNAEQS